MRADELAVEVGPQLAGVGHLSDRRVVELPSRADLLDRAQILGADDRDHPLLALGDHDLPRLQVLFAQRHAVEVNVDAAASTSHLGKRRRKARGTQVLERLDEAALDQLEARLDQLVAGERVADLHRWPFVRVLLAELLAREDAGAADPVSPRRRPVEEDDVSRPGGASTEDTLGREEADTHRVHEAVIRVGRVEDRVTADRRDADAVAVVRDAGHGALEMVVGPAEAEPVEEGDGPRTHRDDVAEDAADPGGGALERLDGRRVVVALDLEGDGLAFAEVEDACVLSGPLKDARRVGREALEEQRRMLVAAVLRPEEREDGELEVVRLALHQLLDTVELPVGEAEGTMERLFGDPRQVVQSSRVVGWGGSL